ncbi:hypothetical protein DM02DRAFT_695165 [Periconia macrospinosa]|uniref:Oxidoreductase acuF-like C2H2 type zinc-finger domain-containing protein n=1 Tax=Periconia macrospinosa TaxID=97972 RepID=A0A2V1D6R4_9PLEO|nr:hypothetical protein DM02DRAFT_695165 [Periconia macrospinosa]
MDSNIPAFLLERLSKAITNRRRYFAYWQKHTLKLSRTRDEPPGLQKNLTASREPRFQGFEAKSTVISYATTAKDVKGKPADLPPLPVNMISNREFMCPYCKVVCPSWQGKGKSWRTHILQDLQPYVCTFPDCSEGDNLYANRAAWIEHERM